MEGIDIALVEGFKLAGKQKIEVVRKEKGTKTISSADELIAVVTDVSEGFFSVPAFQLDDYEKISEFIINKFLVK